MNSLTKVVWDKLLTVLRIMIHKEKIVLILWPRKILKIKIAVRLKKIRTIMM